MEAQNPYEPPKVHSQIDPAYSTQNCFLSTPEHLRTLRGRFLYIYTDSGTLELWADKLAFTGKKTGTTVIGLGEIQRVHRANYPRVAKPIRLDYIQIDYDSLGQRRSLILTPYEAVTAAVWNTNKVVSAWLDRIQTAHLGYTTG